MTTAAVKPSIPQLGPARVRTRPLATGDRLTRDEFERRYASMPEMKKAELIEGVVYMPSPVSDDYHGRPHLDLATWIGVYIAGTPGVRGGDNSTLRLDMDNEPQPDLLLRIDPDARGQTRTSEEGYVEGAPELVVEVAASSASYDLHDKKNACRRNGVQEYLVRRVLDEEVDWFVLREGRYELLEPDDQGVLRSEVFPGLWLDAPALIGGDLSAVFERLQEGLAGEEHAAFVKRLEEAGRRTG